MRVLFVTNHYPTEESPGNSPCIEDQRRAIQRLGHNVDVLFINGTETKLNYLKAMWGVVDYGQAALEKGDVHMLGGAMNICHGMLCAIGVSSAELDKLVWAARRKSQGAKLCGSGRGGIMIALGDISKELKKAGGKVIKTEICEEGVRIER